MDMFSGSRRFAWMFTLILVLATTTVVYVTGCRDEPPSLIVVAGAQDVHYTSLGGTRQVIYEVREKYPAPITLKEISDRLAEQGWKPLDESFLNPGLLSSHRKGWTDFLAGEQALDERVYQWLAEWTNARGDVVMYGLKYHDTGKRQNGSAIDASPTTDRLQVSGIYMPEKVAKEARQEVSSTEQ